jgi:polyhydroxyalkanoate synthesis regulator phasin
MTSRGRTDVREAVESAVDVALGATVVVARTLGSAAKEAYTRCKPETGKSREWLEDFERSGREVRARIRDYACALGCALAERGGVARAAELETLRQRVRDLEQEVAQIKTRES